MLSLAVCCLPVNVILRNSISSSCGLSCTAWHRSNPPSTLCPIPLSCSMLPLPPAEFCKQQLWPILHYLVPLSPTSLGRFDPNLWSAYVRANMAFANKLVEVRWLAWWLFEWFD